MRLEKNNWVFLNRHYKPVGLVQDDWVHYKDYAVPVVGLGPKTARKLDVANQYDKYGCIYLYDDSCAPWLCKQDRDEYLKKISVVMKLRINANIDVPNRVEARATEAEELLEKYVAYAAGLNVER
jgi:hypothetical protein